MGYKRGKGCRFWCSRTMNGLKSNQRVDSSSARIFTVFRMLSKGRVFFKGAWVAVLLGTHPPGVQVGPLKRSNFYNGYIRLTKYNILHFYIFLSTNIDLVIGTAFSVFSKDDHLHMKILSLSLLSMVMYGSEKVRAR